MRARAMAEWNAALTDWLKPFVEKLGHKKRRQMCPLYVTGLIGPGDRKSIEPMAARFAPERYDRLHHPRILNIRTRAGDWHEEVSQGSDRPETDVTG